MPESKSAKADLSPHELSLVGEALQFMYSEIDRTGRLATQDGLRRYLSCKDTSATRIRNYLIKDGGADLARRLRETQNKLRHANLVKNALLDVADKPYEDQTEYLVRENTRLTRALEKARLDKNNAVRVQRDISRRAIGVEDELIKEIDRIAAERATIQFPKAVLAAHVASFEPGGDPQHSEDAVAAWGDQHWGARHTAEDVSGFGAYDIEIGANRWAYNTRQTVRILQMHRAMYPIDNLWIALLGDIGSGELHDLPQTNQLFAPAQVDFGFCMLDFAMQDVLNLRPKVVRGNINIVRTVGNHMRTTKYMPLVFQAQRTNDWLIYRQLYHKYKSVSGVQFIEDDSPFVFQNIRGHRYCITHGTQAAYENNPDRQVKGLHDFIARVRAVFDSPIWKRAQARGGTVSPQEALAREAENLTGSTFDRIIIGNIHVPISMPRILTNGCLPGQNELGVNWTLEPIPAGQWIFGVSNRHVKTWEYFIDCTHVQREGDSPYRLFAAEYAKRFGR